MNTTAEPPRKSSSFMTIELDKPGKHAGFIMIPHSTHDDAWGTTRVPIATIANGTGPTVIVQAGCHGDEYEGQITISEMIRDLDSGEIQGRLILLPASNVHASMGGMRTSPLDGVNMNRTFPGLPYGTITQQTAAFIADRIFPLGDAFLDLHSGGSSLDIIPSAVIEPTDNAALRPKNHAAALAFDAPITVVIGNLGEPRTATATACRAGLVTVATEMAGCGTVSIEALEICRRGTRNVLAHLGVLPPEAASPKRGDTTLLELPGADAWVFSPIQGVFEPFHEKGRKVRRGEAGGRVHTPWDPTRAPVTLAYNADGILYSRRHPGLVKSGSCCLTVAAPYNGPL